MKILTLFLGLLLTANGYAQGTNIKGSVLDGSFDLEPMAFAQVEVKGLNIQTETELDGAFKMNLLEGNYTFIVEYVGYEPVEIDNVVVKGHEVIMNPIVLRPRKRNLDLASISKTN